MGKKFNLNALGILMSSILLLTACTPKAEPAPVQEGAGIANPASENCIRQGGQLNIVQGPNGEYGVCIFEDNRLCEEWAMMRGDCPVGGVKITGYATPAAVFCVITGGEYASTDSNGTDKERGTCTFKNGKSCDVWDYYNGGCSAGG